jgi:hypothetical protein
MMGLQCIDGDISVALTDQSHALRRELAQECDIATCIAGRLCYWRCSALEFCYLGVSLILLSLLLLLLLLLLSRVRGSVTNNKGIWMG